MTTFITNILISIINSVIDIFLIHLFLKILYSIKDDEKNNKLILSIEFLLLVLSNYLKFKYLWIKIILLFIAVYLKGKKYIIKINKSFFILMSFIILKYPFEQVICYIMEFYIFNTRMTYRPSYLYFIKRLIIGIIIKYCDYVFIFISDIFYKTKKINMNHFKFISIFVSFDCLLPIIFTSNSLFYYINIGFTFLFIIFIYCLALVIFIYLDYKHKNKVLEMKLINQNIINETNVIKEKLQSDKEIRKIKHDLKNDLIILNGYISNNSYEMAKDFINHKLNNLMELTQKTHSGNIAIDSIIEQKIKLMNEYNIEYHESISSTYLGDIVEYELALLIELALDNAIEATCRANTKKIICLYISNKQECLMITTSNTIIENSHPNFYQTSKLRNKKNHGLGIGKMREIVKKYQGEMSYKVSSDKVTLKLLLQTNSGLKS